MSNYIPNNDKKRKIRARREQHLRHLIKHGAAKENLITAAEQVREARIGMLKARKANPPMGDLRHPELRPDITAEIQALLEMPVETILGEFGVGAPQDKIAE